jgi:hypothetical protein
MFALRRFSSAKILRIKISVADADPQDLYVFWASWIWIRIH